MSKKPFVHPKIRLWATIKKLRKEVKFWKNEHKKALAKLAKHKQKDAESW